MRPSAPTVSSLQQRLVRGFVATAVGPVTTIIVQIVTVPLFLHYWGTSLYGEWLILSAMPMYLSLGDIGFGNVAGNDMTMRVAAGDRDGALVTFQSTWIIVTTVSAVIAAATAVGLAFFPIRIRSIFHISTLSEHAARVILLLLIGEVLFTLLGNVATQAFRSEGLYALGTFWWNITRFCEYFFGTLTVCFGASPVTVAAVFFAIRVSGTLLVYTLLRVRIPWVRLGIHGISLKRIRELLVPASAFMAFPAGNAISIQGMIIVIGHLMGPVSVVIFSTLRTLTRSATQLMALINNTVWPELSIAYGAGLRLRARNLHRRACQLSLWASIFAVACLAIAGPRVYAVWTHGKVPMDAELFNLLLLVVVANSFWFTSSVASVACNAHKKIAMFYLGGALASIALAYTLTPKIGLDAPAAALLTIDLAMIGVVVPQSMRLLGDDIREFIRSSVAVPPVLSILRMVVQQRTS